MPISGVNPTPHTTAIYASDPALPRRPQDSLPSRLLSFGRTRLALASSYRLLLSHPAPGSCRRSNVIDVQGLGSPFRFDPRIGASCDTPKPALCPGRASASTSSSDWVPSLRPLRHRSSRLCSRVSAVLWTHPTPRLFPDSFAFSTSCRGPGSLLRLRARRGLPGSDAFPSCVMWSQTPAGRRVLA